MQQLLSLHFTTFFLALVYQTPTLPRQMPFGFKNPFASSGPTFTGSLRAIFGGVDVMMLWFATAMIVTGIAWLFVEGNLLRSNYVGSTNQKKAIRVTVATSISLVGIVTLAIAGVMTAMGG